MPTTTWIRKGTLIEEQDLSVVIPGILRAQHYAVPPMPLGFFPIMSGEAGRRQASKVCQRDKAERQQLGSQLYILTANTPATVLDSGANLDHW